VPELLVMARWAIPAVSEMTHPVPTPFRQSMNTVQLATLVPAVMLCGRRTSGFVTTETSKVSKEQHFGAKCDIFTLIVTLEPWGTTPELVTFKVGLAASARGKAGNRRSVAEIKTSAGNTLERSK